MVENSLIMFLSSFLVGTIISLFGVNVLNGYMSDSHLVTTLYFVKEYWWVGILYGVVGTCLYNGFKMLEDVVINRKQK